MQRSAKHRGCCAKLSLESSDREFVSSTDATGEAWQRGVTRGVWHRGVTREVWQRGVAWSFGSSSLAVQGCLRTGLADGEGASWRFEAALQDRTTMQYSHV